MYKAGRRKYLQVCASVTLVLSLALLGGHRVVEAAASLLGIFTGNDNSTTSLATSARTTTAGSLVTFCGAAWTGSPGNDLTIASNLAGTYTEAIELEFVTAADVALVYNIGGTRGATHTGTLTDTEGGTSSMSITGQEFDGVDASPTVVTNSATGTSTTPAVSVSVAAASLVVGCMAYDGAASTIAVSDGTQASEQDEDNSFQAQSVAYKVGQTGTPTLGWTLGASRPWAAIIVAFTEAGGGGAPANGPRLPLVGVAH